MSEVNQGEDIEALNVAVFGCDERQTVGLNKRTSMIEQVLHGEHGNLGLVQKVNVVWRVHVWLLCLFSGIAGSFLTLLIQRITHQ